MAARSHKTNAVRSGRVLPNDRTGIQVPVGRIFANRTRWQIVLYAPDKPSIYRLHNVGSDPANSMIVEVDGSKRPIHLDPGASVDVMAKRIRVKAGTGGQDLVVEGWYVLVS